MVLATRHNPPLRRGLDRCRRAARRQHRARARQPDGDHGAVGLGQVDPDAHPRRARPADLGQRLARRHRDHRPRRQRADQAAPPPHRLHLPVLQPAADADRGGEHPPAAGDRRDQARRGVAGGPDRTSRARGPALPPPGRALRRPAAAGRDRPRPCLQTDCRLRRRADRQPRLLLQRRDPRPPALLGRRLRADDADGHPRRRRGRRRRPRPLPRRRQDRPRPRRSGCGPGGGGDAGPLRRV